jgi:hypothetical protein
MAEQKTVPAHGIEVKTEPLRVKMGITPSAVVPRADLAGLRLKAPNNPDIYLVVPDGYLRYIPNPTTYNNLFRDWNGVILSHDIPNIAKGLDLTDGAVLVQPIGTIAVYIVSKGIKGRITSPGAMDKYYFNWDTVFEVPRVLVDSIPAGVSWI